MNKKNLLVASVLVWSVYFTGSSGFAQGSLTPPGPPAPTMVTLTQLASAIGQAEPRTMLSLANTPGDSNNLFIINQSGSYYLTTNLSSSSSQNGVEITANNVTLDLSGFTLQSSIASNGNYGVYIPNAVNNVTVRNGSINGWAIGVNAGVTASTGLVFDLLNLSDNNQYGIVGSNATCVARNCSIQDNGIGLEANGLITGCVANDNEQGIICPSFGTVAGCTANDNFGAGINVTSGTVSGCTVENNSASGIVLYSGSVSGCTVADNALYGIFLAPGTATGCYVNGNSDSGIYVAVDGSEVVGNNCKGNNTSGAGSNGGIFLICNNSRIEDNQVSGSGGRGIAIYSSSYTNNIIIKNTVSGNGGNDFSIPGANVVGPTITTTGTITSTSPWANFAF